MKFKNKKSTLIILFTLLLTFLFPYTGDDWMWGSNLGLSLLKKGFSNYNGRYAGNIIVILLTRSRLFRMLIMTFTILGILYLCLKIVNKNKKNLFYIGYALFLMIPKAIFRQAIVWSSGFTNYAISIFLTLIYIYINKDIIIKKNENKSNKDCLLILILGFVSSLFIENITIYNIALAIIIIIYSIKKYKKVTNYNMSYLIGAIMGSVLMFTNSAYQNVLNGTDHYRTISSGIFNLFKKYFEVISFELIFNNLLLNIVITTLLIILTNKFLNQNKDTNKTKKDVLLFATIINISYVFYTFIATINPSWLILIKYTIYFEGVYTILYFLSILVITFITISNKHKKTKLLFYLVSIIILTLPLFFVTPVGSRCFFATYVMFIIYTVELVDYLFEGEKLKHIDKTTLLILITLGIYWLNIYGYIFVKDYFRNRNVKSMSKISQSVIVPILPYQDYVWMSTPLPKYGLEKNYKLFYNIDSNIKFYYIDLNK